MKKIILLVFVFSMIVSRGYSIEDSNNITISKYFDFGVIAPYQIEGNKIVFNLTDHNNFHINCLIKSKTKKITIQFDLTPKYMSYFENQGLYTSANGIKYEVINYNKINDKTLQAEIELVNGVLFVSTVLPYGRDNFDDLLIQTANCGKWRLIRKMNRSVPIFEIGEDDRKKPVHYLFSGEDTYETAGQWVADNMIRILCSDKELAKKLGDKAVIRICPAISLYSLTSGFPSYTNIDGKPAYGGGAWRKTPLPIETSVIHDMIKQTISEKRLGFVMPIHGWWAAIPFSEIEAIKTGGKNVLSAERADWALKTMNTIMDGVPHKRVKLAEKAWFNGILREYLLSKYNIISFKIEITTNSCTYEEDYKKTAEAILNNLAKIDDWMPVLE